MQNTRINSIRSSGDQEGGIGQVCVRMDGWMDVGVLSGTVTRTALPAGVPLNNLTSGACSDTKCPINEADKVAFPVIPAIVDLREEIPGTCSSIKLRPQGANPTDMSRCLRTPRKRQPQYVLNNK